MLPASKPHNLYNSGIDPCSMNVSGIPMRFTRGVYPLSAINSRTALPSPPFTTPFSTVMTRLNFCLFRPVILHRSVSGKSCHNVQPIFLHRLLLQLLLSTSFPIGPIDKTAISSPSLNFFPFPMGRTCISLRQSFFSPFPSRITDHERARSLLCNPCTSGSANPTR